MQRELGPALPHVASATASGGLAAWYAVHWGVGAATDLVWIALPTVLSVVILAAGERFRRLEPTRRQVLATAALLGGGGVYGGGFVAVIQFLQSLGGGTLVRPAYMTAMAAVGGVAMATAIAHYYVGYTQRIRDIRAESARSRRLQKQASVLNRTLRHNLRNELQVIDGWLGAAFGQEDVDPDRGRRVIRDHLDELSDASERARRIERVLGTDEQVSVDVTAAVEDAAATVGRPVTVSTETPATAPARVHPEIRAAIGEVFENAVEHNDRVDLTVSATVRRAPDGDRWLVDVTDDGGGIPSVELDALEEATEGPLKHGRGLGLYLIQTVVDQSGGSLSVSSEGAGGTTVSMALPVDHATAGDGLASRRPERVAAGDGSETTRSGVAHLD
ncbi:sensor histidine kinase [Haloarcula litorea]|uniref:sensor histidine kinase n=1 Tax=Haloarcula litorea TaxID=3032579 RepID=UPI0023E8E0CD|nr:HAMP domain-containing sensor histidine kinase [Halomicroarcula sp. GDY20]